MIGLTTTGLWLAVLASGVYHGLNPGMGWPLAVAAGLRGRGWPDTVRSLGPIALGHGLALGTVLLPFALLFVLLRWQWEIRVLSAMVVIAFGLWLRFARHGPHTPQPRKAIHLTWWSFVIANAHGAGLMLVPIYLGMCGSSNAESGHQAMSQLVHGSVATALAVSLAHTVAMVAAGGGVALFVQMWCRSAVRAPAWLGADALWSASLIVVGIFTLAVAWAGGG